MAKLILASASPRRRELLEQIGLQFDVFVSEVEENIPFSSPEKYVEELALMKGLWVAERIPSGVVLAADTIVVYKNEVMGKPKGDEEAKVMLKKLSGDTHDVITGIVLLDVGNNKRLIGHCVTKVQFKDLTDRVIEGYVATGEPADKAGAYGIQGLGACLVDKIEGCYFNVVGLPISKLVDFLPEFDIKIL